MTSEPTHAALTDTSAPTTPAPSAFQETVWYGIRFSPPPDHTWEPVVAPPSTYYGAPLLAQGQIVFTLPPGAHPVEQPEGLTLTLVTFSGTAHDWLELLSQARPVENPIDPASVRSTTLAGLPALAYSHIVTGVSRHEQLVVPLGDDYLLLIGVSNADYAPYATTLAAIKIDRPPR